MIYLHNPDIFKQFSLYMLRQKHDVSAARECRSVLACLQHTTRDLSEHFSTVAFLYGLSISLRSHFSMI